MSQTVMGTREVRFYQSLGVKFFILTITVIGGAVTIALFWVFIGVLPVLQKGGVDIPYTIGAAALKLTVVALLLGCPLWLYCFYKAVLHPLKELGDTMVRVGEGDLATRIALKRQDEIGRLGAQLSRVVSNLRDIVAEVRAAAERVASSSQQLSSSSDEVKSSTQQITSTIQDLAKGSEIQAQKVEETSEAVRHVASSVKHAADQSQQAAEFSVSAADTARMGEDAAKQAVAKMTEVETVISKSAVAVESLGERSQEIGTIVNVITGIADQTNLLALNAAIEAARAGEYGRGFAVVAEEVRKLAEGSAKAAEQISTLIQEVQHETKLAVDAMQLGTEEVSTGAVVVNKAGDALGEIITAVQDTAQLAGQISDALKLQVDSGEKVDKAMTDIAAVAEESAAGTEEVAAATEEQTASMEQISSSAHDLAEMAMNLDELVRRFKIN